LYAVFLVPHFTASYSTEQLNGNPATYPATPSGIACEEKTKTQLNSKDISEDAVVSNGVVESSSSSSDEESLSNSEDYIVPGVTDVLTDAGVTINLDELQPTEPGQAPLELITEVSLLVT